MSTKEKIKEILKEDITKDKITRISIFDFDGTLIDTPTPDRGHKEYKDKTGQEWPYNGWWGKPESLDMEIFDMKPIPSVIGAYKKEKATPNTFVVLLTGRIPRLSTQVKKILDVNGLTFDAYYYNNISNTLDFKINVMGELLQQFPDVKSMVLFDDRDEHIPSFRAWGEEQDGIDFHITHVKGNHHGPQ